MRVWNMLWRQSSHIGCATNWPERTWGVRLNGWLMILLTLYSWAQSWGVGGLPKRPHTVSWETNGKCIAETRPPILLVWERGEIGGGADFTPPVLWYGTFGAMEQRFCCRVLHLCLHLVSCSLSDNDGFNLQMQMYLVNKCINVNKNYLIFIFI